MTSFQRIIGLLILTVFMLIVQYRLYRPRALRAPAFHWVTRAVIIDLAILFWVREVIIRMMESMPH